MEQRTHLKVAQCFTFAKHRNNHLVQLFLKSSLFRTMQVRRIIDKGPPGIESDLSFIRMSFERRLIV